jgi:hypothetical protein
MVGVLGGPTTATFFVPVALDAPLVTTHFNASVPAVPAVKVMALVVVPLVIVPFVIVQAYVAPEVAVTDAESPVAPTLTSAGAVMVAAGAALTVTHAVSFIVGMSVSVAV